ncbi:carbohydrate ABC transporter permease [Breznakiella homolactica]|uniref:Sugar ABC transporter permease n=1 Tax=Breznakiella homolactica TaxID=2798577 RepID=A0A7T8B9D3_9SPIR|nr:sugar ABC transporter permease [Breznakiella homolactica]QQO08342.1 sugar ABC transporter permease [Breznakiella homolactica]
MTLAKKRILTAYAFLALPLLYFICVRFIPMLYAMVMGMTNWGLLAKELKFVGFDNFRTIFSDPVFHKAFGNTIKYAVIGAPLVIVISLFFALQLNVINRGKGLYRLLYVLPYITPIVAVSWVWRWMYQPPPIGLINGVLSYLGLKTQGFLNDPGQALYCITLVNVWVELGYCITIFLAGIQNIPVEYIEAAKIDGASSRTLLFRITLPLLLPITLFLMVMEGIQFLRIFTQVYNMSVQATGGPLDSTKSVALYIYQTAFTKFQMGLAASASMVLFLLIMAVTLIQIKFFDRKVSY